MTRVFLIATFSFGAGMGLAAAQQSAQQSAQPLAQQSGPVSLDHLLDVLQANNMEYARSVPNFFCQERVSSEIEPNGTPFGRRVIVTESTFRIRRTPAPNGLVDLKESRDVKRVNGKLYQSDDEVEKLAGPSMVFGIFSTALSLVAADQKPCFDYKFASPKKQDPPHVLVIEYVARKPDVRPATCIEKELSRGRALIDPATLRVTRMEQKTNAHTIMPGLDGQWTWTVDYAPSDLGGKTFWLPTRIVSLQLADRNLSQWNFDGTYTDYHRLSATTKILPMSEGALTEDGAAPATPGSKPAHPQ